MIFSIFHDITHVLYTDKFTSNLKIFQLFFLDWKLSVKFILFSVQTLKFIKIKRPVDFLTIFTEDSFFDSEIFSVKERGVITKGEGGRFDPPFHQLKRPE